MKRHDRAKETAKTTYLASALGRLHDAYRRHTAAEGQTRSRILEATLGRLTSVLPQARPLDAVLQRLLTAVPRSTASTDTWREEPRILKLIRTYRQAASGLAVSRTQQLAELATRLSRARRALRVDLSPPEYFNLFEVLRIKRREYIHSNVLGWLLDPLGNHGLGTRFLNGLLQVQDASLGEQAIDQPALIASRGKPWTTPRGHCSTAPIWTRS